jgi:hypothetical protein
MSALATLVILLWLLCLAVRMGESSLCRGLLGELRRMWIAAGIPGRLLAVLVLVVCAQSGGTKEGPTPLQSLFKFLFWDPGQPWQLSGADAMLDGAQESVAQAEADLDEVDAVTASNDVVTLSFDWHAPDRLPYHERQNVLAWTAQVVPTNINGTLYEDHYIAFNASASTNPAVILIEYAQQTPAGIVRYSSEVTTNSFPDTTVVELQSGSHTCYWFRCPVPTAFTNELRDWNGEALFGSPSGSGRGFDLLGTLVVDDGDDIWVGATTNIFMGGITNEFRNGINVTEDGQ